MLFLIIFFRAVKASEVRNRRLHTLKVRFSFLIMTGVCLHGVVLIRVVTFRCVAVLRGLLFFRFNLHARCVPNDVRRSILFGRRLNLTLIFLNRRVSVHIRITSDVPLAHGRGIFFHRLNFRCLCSLYPFFRLNHGVNRRLLRFIKVNYALTWLFLRLNCRVTILHRRLLGMLRVLAGRFLNELKLCVHVIRNGASFNLVSAARSILCLTRHARGLIRFKILIASSRRRQVAFVNRDLFLFTYSVITHYRRCHARRAWGVLFRALSSCSFMFFFLFSSTPTGAVAGSPQNSYSAG